MTKFVTEITLTYRYEIEAETKEEAEEHIWEQLAAGLDLFRDIVGDPIISIMTKEEFDKIKWTKSDLGCGTALVDGLW